MQTQTEYEDIDFTKKMKKVVARVEKQSYKKLSFLMVGCAALIFGGYTGSNVAIDYVKKEISVREQQKQLLVQNIKQMDEKEFANMLEYISQNVDMYDSKVNYIQQIIIKADKEETNTSSTSRGEEIGIFLTKYKEKIKEDVAQLLKVRNNVSNNIEVSKSDIDIFFNYMSAYKSKLIITDATIDNKIHNLVFNAPSGNIRYNEKHNVYSTLKSFDNEIKNFQYVEVKTTLKPKM